MTAILASRAPVLRRSELSASGWARASEAAMMMQSSSAANRAAAVAAGCAFIPEVCYRAWVVRITGLSAIERAQAGVISARAAPIAIAMSARNGRRSVVCMDRR